MRRRALLAAGATAASTTAGALILPDAEEWVAPPGVTSGQGLHHELQPFEARTARVLTGEPHFRALEFARSSDGRSTQGVWACDGPCTFDWTFERDEAVHLLDGEVHVEYEGRHFTLRPGGSATFRAETTARWQVPWHARKVYSLREPGRLVRWMRRVSHPSGSS